MKKYARKKISTKGLSFKMSGDTESLDTLYN